MSKRFINFRPIVLIALAFICGILCGYAYLRGYAWLLWTTLALCVSGGVIVAFFKKTTALISIAIVAVVLLAGYFDFNIIFKKFTADIYADTYCDISGKLTDYYADYGDSAFVIVKNPTIYFDGKVKTFKDKDVGVWIYFTEEITSETIKNKVGSYIDFSCLLNNAPVFADGINTFYVKNNIGFVATNISDIEITEGRASFDETVRLYIKNTLNENMTTDTASVGIALLLGDKSALSNDLQNGYRTMGISHVFAVSGLHIGFIYSVIGFFIFKLRIAKWKAVPLTFIPMLFYAWLCGFSSSVIRALVMTTCSLFFQAIGGRNDTLNSIAVSALIILTICPLYLFDAGFLMSFSAVIGINCVSRILLRYLSSENKILNFFGNTFAISFGASIGVIGVSAHFFGEITLWGFLFNIVITPLISVVFVTLLIGLIPFLNFVLILPKYFFTFTNTLAMKFSLVEFGSFEVKSFGLALLILFVAMFVFGGYFNLTKKLKLIVLSVLSGLFLVVGILKVAPKETSFAVECFDAITDYCYAVTDTQNIAYVVSDFENKYETTQIVDFCLDKNIKKMYVLMFDYDNLRLDNIALLLEYDLEVVGIYMPLDNADNEKDLFLQQNDIDKFVLINGDKLEFEKFNIICLVDGENTAWYLKSQEVDMLFCSKMTTTAFDKICRNFVNKVDIVFSSYNEQYILKNSNCLAVVTKNYFDAENIFSSKHLGKLTIKFVDDKITIIP